MGYAERYLARLIIATAAMGESQPGLVAAGENMFTGSTRMLRKFCFWGFFTKINGLMFHRLITLS